MRINVAVPESRISAPILNAALEGVTRLDERLLKERAAPLFRDVVGKGRVRWKPEPPGQEHFDHAGLVMRRGWGDCDDLGPWHAAGLRVTGEDPGAHAVVRRSGPKRWHVVVRRSDGTIDDPSIEAGMPRPGRRIGVIGACQMPMLQGGCVGGAYIALPNLGLRPMTRVMAGSDRPTVALAARQESGRHLHGESASLAPKRPSIGRVHRRSDSPG